MLRRTSSFEVASSTEALFGTVNTMMQWFSCLLTAALCSGVHVLLLAHEILSSIREEDVNVNLSISNTIDN